MEVEFIFPVFKESYDLIRFPIDERRSPRHSTPQQTESLKLVPSVPTAQGCLHRGKADNQVFAEG